MLSEASYGVCQVGCDAGAVACYSAAGFVFGTVTAGLGTPAAVLTCNSILSACMTTCAVRYLGEASAEGTGTICIY
ncbi:hypothetical protein KIPB_015417 [Kipferlia bialata]|uniref:Uncharacterized protein n=1 Tax=Kipferlia bialata TaxID=797122 RepID=A0A9K3DB72_9EUKA|nr:hypothetical protein KIPB_015417 [Kipferlia bialata]|eukprot:g15417.t1